MRGRRSAEDRRTRSDTLRKSQQSVDISSCHDVMICGLHHFIVLAALFAIRRMNPVPCKNSMSLKSLEGRRHYPPA